MQEGLLYIGLGAVWLLMVAITGYRKTISSKIFLLVGILAICYGLFKFVTGMGPALATIIVLCIAALTCIATIAYGKYKKRSEITAQLSDDSVPVPSAEEKFLREIYKTKKSKENESID